MSVNQNRGLSHLLSFDTWSERCQKSFHKGNWRVAAKRTLWHCNLSFNIGFFNNCVRLFVSQQRRWGGFRSSWNRLLKSQGWVVATTVVQGSTRGTRYSSPWFMQLQYSSLLQSLSLIDEKGRKCFSLSWFWSTTTFSVPVIQRLVRIVRVFQPAHFFSTSPTYKGWITCWWLGRRQGR